MKFTTTIYDFKKPKESQNNKIAYLIWGIVLIALFGINQKILPSNILINSILIICLFILAFIRMSTLFKNEEHTKKVIGVLEIEIEKLIWNERQIVWDDIEQIAISFFDYNGRFLYKGKGDYGNNQSNGLDNEIKIILKDSTKYKGNIFIESEQSIKDLREVLWSVIKKNKISIENAKKMINPGNYKEHQEIKKYCS